MAEIPLFKPDKLGESMRKAADMAVDRTIKEAKAWVVDNKDEFADLGEELVEAVLFKAAYDVVPLPDLTPDAPQEVLTDAEAVINKKLAVFAVVTQAQRENSERIARLEKSAKSLVLKIGTVGATLLLRGMIGG